MLIFFIKIADEHRLKMSFRTFYHKKVYFSNLIIDIPVKVSDNKTYISIENRFGLHRHIQCRPGQQPLQACPEGALQKLRLIEERYG